MVLRHRALGGDEIMDIIVIITKTKIKPSFLVPYGEREQEDTICGQVVITAEISWHLNLGLAFRTEELNSVFSKPDAYGIVLQQPN